jgi:hypothetical protein
MTNQQKKLTKITPPVKHKELWDRSSVGLERCPVTAEVAGSSPVGPATILNVAIKAIFFLYEKIKSFFNFF